MQSIGLLQQNITEGMIYHIEAALNKKVFIIHKTFNGIYEMQ